MYDDIDCAVACIYPEVLVPWTLQDNIHHVVLLYNCCIEHTTDLAKHDKQKMHSSTQLSFCIGDHLIFFVSILSITIANSKP